MTVRQAVQERNEAAVEAAQAPSVATVVRQAIEAQSPAFRAVLPRHVDAERFSRLTLTAVKSTPDLMRCFETEQGRTSLLLAAMQAATIGLEPNTPTQDAWLLPRRNGKVWEAELSIGYRGLLKLCRRANTIKTIFAEVVREGDHFEWSRGLESDVLDHKPVPRDQSGELTHAYAVARYHAGGYNFVVLDRVDVEDRRAMSESWKSTKARPYSPWTKWTASMWRKSALRALVPFLDLSPEQDQAVALDGQTFSLDEDDGAVVPALPAIAGTPETAEPAEDHEPEQPIDQMRGPDDE